MALTRYKILARTETRDLREVAVVEAHSATQAVRKHIEKAGGSGPFVATPESNWTELTPTIRTVTTISFLDADGAVEEPDDGQDAA